MVRVVVGLSVGVLLGACGGGSSSQPDAGADDAGPPPADVVLSTPTTTIGANGHTHRVITLQGEPHASLVLGVEPAGAGHFTTPTTVTLDDNGTAIARFVPCDASTDAGCLGDVTLTAAHEDAPDTPTGALALHFIMPADISTIDPCVGVGNVLHVDGDFPVDGTFTTSPTAAFSLLALPDAVELTVDDSGRYHAAFALNELFEPMAVGTFEDAHGFGATPDPMHPRPGVELQTPGEACGTVEGAFQIYDIDVDPVYGDVSSVTIGFQQSCTDIDEPNLVEGCLHFEQTFPPPVTPTPEDPPGPDDVTVTVLAGVLGPDSTAEAVFTDTFGTVVSDVVVDANGVARAALPFGGEVTVIQIDGLKETLTTFRQVLPGDDLHIGDPVPGTPGGRGDGMLVKSDPPPDGGGITYVYDCGPPPTVQVPGDIAFSDACRTPTFSMLEISNPATPPRHYAFQTGLIHQGNGDVVGPTAADWQEMSSSTVTLANAPGALDLAVNLSRGVVVDGIAKTLETIQVQPPFAAAPHADLLAAPTVPSGVVLRSEIVQGSSFIDTQVVWSADPTAATIDDSALALPAPSGVVQSVNGGTWTETGGTGATPDLRVVIWTARFGSPQRKVNWTVVEDPSSTTPGVFTVPTLPATHAAEDPTLDPNNIPTGAAAEYIDLDFVTGYDEARDRALQLRTLDVLSHDTPYRAHKTASPVLFRP